MKKLGEIAEIKALTSNTELIENNILVSRTGKKIVKISENEITEYKEKNGYLVVISNTEFTDSVYTALNSKDFQTWFDKTAKGTAMPLISVVELKEFEINI